jgi:transcription-repair coupling factor (superfamily II helicase)
VNLFDKLYLNKLTPPFLSGKGNFVVEDVVGFALYLASIYKKTKNKYLIIVSNLYKAQSLYNSLSSFIPDEKVAFFPMDELIRSEAIAESKELIAQRLYTLSSIKNKESDIIIANVAAANRYLPSPDFFNENTLRFKVGEEYNLSEIRKKLILAGYSLVNKIDQSLQFAIRGDILDIFSVNLAAPVRLEFFGDELESIRYFDIATQLSNSRIKEVSILPANDMILSNEEITNGIEKISQRLKSDLINLSPSVQERLSINVSEDISNLSERNFVPRLYKYFSFIVDKQYSIFDYISDYTKIIFDAPQVESENKLLNEESWSFLEELVSEGNIISGLDVMQDLNKKINDKTMIFTYPLARSIKDNEFHFRSVPFLASKEKDSINIIRTYLNEGYEILIALSTYEQLNACEKLLIDEQLTFEKVEGISLPKKEKIGVSLFNIEEGTILEEEKVVILSNRELFNIKTKSVRYINKFKEGTILKSYEDLTPGDYVVHEFQGIGQFVSLETIEIEGKHKDFIKLAYSGTDFLYVPLEQFQLVRKYMGKEGHAPKLSRLHSKDWENTKKRIKERVNQLAERLMKLYTERSKIKGYPFKQDDEFQKAFEDNFPYRLTLDQQRSLDEIKLDMEKETPMDRLLCGDVGFGKTEVAFRAAFKAINSGKQVAILCPTTLLARQHFERALERFTSFDIKVALFSRMVSAKKENEYLSGVRDGSIHLVIGTHKLLSKRLVFNDLGLLIVDEEQRFGVEQKEKIKELKTNVDVLTLSATPIPRTLQISLLGVRSMSMINTAPEDRMPVQTYVIPYKNEVVKELIERELARHGQVFYLHNNVSTLYSVANKIQKMLPKASIGVAHGQMDKDTIDEAMVKFSSNNLDILVCTSIIENGIDIPNANMIIVDDSDHYGLAQLYQIRGRVGRSDRIAYAYLMYNGNKVLNEKAEKRLKAIKDFTALGSGYKIAQRDLMIRGAGDILGPDQAGFIDSIGLDMYIKLLNETIKEKLGEQKEEVATILKPDLSLDAYIPNSYASEADKIELYQTIESSPSLEDLAIIKTKMNDIYGKMPEQVLNLFKIKEVDILKSKAKVETLRVYDNHVAIILGEEYLSIKGVGNLLFETLLPFLSRLKITYKDKRFKMRLEKNKNWIDDLIKLLQSFLQVLTSKTTIRE